MTGTMARSRLQLNEIHHRVKEAESLCCKELWCDAKRACPPAGADGPLLFWSELRNLI